MFLTSLNFMVYLNCSHQHTHFHQHFGLLCGLADCLFYYSLVIHSSGLHFPSCQALPDSVIWYGTLSRACFRWLSGKLRDAFSPCSCFPGFWRPALPPSLIIKTWYTFEVLGLAGDAAFIFLPQTSRFVFISVHLLLPLEIVSFSFARNFQSVLIYAPGIC